WDLELEIWDFLSSFLLVVVSVASYYQRMKRISLLLITLSLCASPSARSQDAATEERLNKISGQIDDLIAGQKEQRERLSALMRELESVREQASKRSANSDTHDDLKRLAENLRQVDR